MKWQIGCALLAVLVAGGCKTVNTVTRAEPVAQSTPLADKRVITDGGLGRTAEVVAIRQTTVSGDLLRLDIDVRNSSSNQQRFNYIFEWFDAQGMQVFTPMSRWQGQIIEGAETITLTAIAPTPTAKDFRLKFQKSRY
jgi:uncharacterized protein YcfL